MKVIYKPYFIIGDIDVILKYDDGTLRPSPLYHFVAEDGSADIYSFKHSDFEYAGNNSNK